MGKKIFVKLFRQKHMMDQTMMLIMVLTINEVYVIKHYFDKVVMPIFL